MNWDSDFDTKIKDIEYNGNDSLEGLKQFVASLPDTLAANQTARIRLELVTQK